MPDRFGAARGLVLFALLEAGGLLLFATMRSAPAALGALVVLGVGQALAVPSLGVLALAPVAADHQGSAAGLFFAYFDAARA